MQGARMGYVTVGHPVDVAFGILFNSWEDIRISGKMDIVWERQYSTGLLDLPSNIIGPGWTVKFLATFRKHKDGYSFFGAAGSEIEFDDPNGIVQSGGTLRNLDTFAELKREKDTYIVTFWYPEWHDAERFVFQDSRDEEILKLKSVEDMTGQGIDLQYNRSGKLSIIQQRREKRSLTINYNEQRLVSSVSLLSDNQEKHLVRYEYDGKGRLIVAYDALGFADRYEYDDNNLMVQEITRGGGIFTFRYDTAGRCISTSGIDRYNERMFKYFDFVQMTEVTDSLGEIWRYQWKPTGQVEKIISPIGLISITVYDDHDRIVEKADPNNAVTKYEYDENGNRSKISNPLGEVTKFEYNDRHQLTKFIDTAGSEWKLEYDENGNLLSTEDALGNRWKCKLNQYGEVIEAEDASGGQMWVNYDDRGELIEHSDWEGNVTKYSYDDFGRIYKKIDPLGYETKFVYDDMGRLTTVYKPDNSLMKFGYNPAGNLVMKADANGNVTRYLYGPCNRLMEAIDPLGYSTKYKWSTEPNRLVEIVNENDRSYHFEYDADGRLIAELDFEGRRLTRSYDKGGNCIGYTDGLNQEVFLEYDDLHRLIRKRLPDDEVTFEYDVMGNIINAKNSACEVAFERDATGRVIKEKQNEYEIESIYDTVGNRIERKTNQGHKAKFAYNHNCLLTALYLDDQIVTSFERDALGQEILRSFPEGIVVKHQYDNLGRMTQQLVNFANTEDSNILGGQKQANIISQRTYKYDPSNNLLETIDQIHGVNRYAYDSTGQAIQVICDKGNNEVFEYDPAGNIKRNSRGVDWNRMKDEVWEYSSGNRLVRKGNTRYEYDNDGRVVRKIEEDAGSLKIWEYGWNCEGWLSSVKCPDGCVWEYKYDVFGRRIKKESSESSVTYVWDGDLIVHEIHSKENINTWLFESDSFAPILAMKDNQMYFSVNDYNGTPQEFMQSDGHIAWAMNLSLWGEADTVITQEVDFPIRFQGQWYDEESGLAYNRFRYYDPAIGRFYSPDPIGISGGNNIYQYVPCPTAWLDPFGLERITRRVGNRTYTFDRDSQGRVTRAEGPLSNPNRTNEHRDTSAQRRVSSGTGYHAGHLIGNQFGAPGGEENLVLMCSSLNLSSWKIMENQLRKLTRNNRVRVTVNVHYDDDSTIPSKFTVDATVEDREGNVTRRRWLHENCS